MKHGWASLDMVGFINTTVLDKETCPLCLNGPVTAKGKPSVIPVDCNFTLKSPFLNNVQTRRRMERENSECLDLHCFLLISTISCHLSGIKSCRDHQHTCDVPNGWISEDGWSVVFLFQRQEMTASTETLDDLDSVPQALPYHSNTSTLRSIDSPKRDAKEMYLKSKALLDSRRKCRQTLSLRCFLTLMSCTTWNFDLFTQQWLSLSHPQSLTPKT